MDNSGLMVTRKTVLRGLFVRKQGGAVCHIFTALRVGCNLLAAIRINTFHSPLKRSPPTDKIGITVADEGAETS